MKVHVPIVGGLQAHNNHLSTHNRKRDAMATGRAIAKKALDQLNRTLSPEDARFFLDTTLEDLWKEARRIEYEQGQRMDLRFMRRVEGFLQTMESYSGVIEVFCQGFSPMAFVWVTLVESLTPKPFAQLVDRDQSNSFSS